MVRDFSRQEASLISGLSLNQLDYLNRNEIVKPEKVGVSKRATVLYNWNQVIELRLIAKLKDVKTPESIIYILLDSLRNKLNLKVRWNNTSKSIQIAESISLKDFEKPLIIVQSSNQVDIFTNVEKQPCSTNGKQLSKVSYLYVIDEKDEFRWFQALKNTSEYGLQDVHTIPPLGKISDEVEKIARTKIKQFESRLQTAS